MIDIMIIVVSFMDILFFNITSTYTVIWHLLFCGADQDNQCMWDWNEELQVSATTRGSNK